MIDVNVVAIGEDFKAATNQLSLHDACSVVRLVHGVAICH